MKKSKLKLISSLIINESNTNELEKKELFKLVENSSKEDFLFLDPPYRPGEKELVHDHYVHSRFTFEEHGRLAKALRTATKRKIKWAMTISSHREILDLYKGLKVIPIKRGTGKMPGAFSRKSGEVLICNY